MVACAVMAVPAGAGAAPYPDGEAMRAVRVYVKQRQGDVGVAVVRTDGRVRGINGRSRFVGASVVKAMLLVAYLRRVDAQGRALTDRERAQLTPMIRRSSNRAATWAYAQLGSAPLRRIAQRAGMSEFWICCSWGSAQFSARDQAKVFWRLERLTPRRFRGYALGLLGSIIPKQTWAIPEVGRPRGYSVFFKGGWRRTPRGRLVHQVALLERGGRRFSLAILTDGNPSMRYALRTLRGVALRVVR